MPGTLNHCTFIGNVGSDAEMKYLATGTAIINWRLAVNNRNKQGDESTTWITCTMFGERAEKLATSITKGKSLYVAGRFSPREWTDEKTGTKHHRSEFVINDVQFLDRQQGGQRQRDDEDDLPFS